MEYIFGQIAIAVFAITGVIAASKKVHDLFGLVVLGVITALGGGTLRDITLNHSVFWIEDFTYVWVAMASALITFLVFRFFNNTYRILLYLDALGVALFSIQAIDKSLALGCTAPVAIIMGLLTSIGGGIIRDVLSGRPNLLVNKEFYAIPILIGCVFYTTYMILIPSFVFNSVLSICIIFGLRAVSIYFELSVPAWLLIKPIHK
ncbi:MAG: trimeric intracellular cation channel family protein [Desulfobacteraceae bacterium]|nr:trimeric intracellular cation channel family protein [Desulfobacteraceae bacterium]